MTVQSFTGQALMIPEIILFQGVLAGGGVIDAFKLIDRCQYGWETI